MSVVKSDMSTIKCVTVGDGSVGKTCMLISYTTNTFPGEYTPTVFDNYTANLIVDGEAVTLVLWDTPGQMDYDRLRPLSYPDTDVFIVCFAINDRPTVNNVRDKWCPEIKKYCPTAPLILVATKVDLRDKNNGKDLAINRIENNNHCKCDGLGANDLKGNNNTRLISREEGVSLKEELQATCYIECSALTQVGINDVFVQAAHSVIYKRKKKLEEKQPVKICGKYEKCCAIM